MTLTEQWNKGELPEGDYYIERRNGYLLYDNIDSHGVWRNSIDEDIVEVLAPVPSYEEWQQLRKWCEEFNALDVAKENQQLKELLLDCRQKFLEAEKNYGFDDSIIDICDPIIDKIDEVLK